MFVPNCNKPAASTERTLATGRQLLLSLALAIVAAIVIAVGFVHFREVPAVPLEMRFEINTPPTNDPESIAISPDGTKIVFAATSEGRSRLWLRSLNSSSARPLTGTDAGLSPFWSPDSRSIGFFANAKLMGLDLDRGSPQTLTDAPVGKVVHGIPTAQFFFP